MVFIENLSTTTDLRIDHDTTSTAANRFYCPGGQNMVIGFGGGMLFRYDGTTQRWFAADSGNWPGLRIQHGVSTNASIEQIEIVDGNGIVTSYANSTSGNIDELQVTFSVEEDDDFDWTGEHTYAESASGPSVAAGQGAFWPQSTAPSRPMFTGDEGDDWALGYACVSVNTTIPTATNATTNLSCGGSYTVPANTPRAGTLYRFYGMYTFVETAAPPTLTLELLVDGVAIRSMTITSAASAGTRGGEVWGYLRYQTIGAGGTMMCSQGRQNNHGSTEDERVEPSLSVGTDAVDTTANHAIELRIRMTTAVASNTLTVTQGFIERLA
jgi:hypothetical protein